MVRALVMAALIALTAGCGEGTAKDILDDQAALEAAAHDIEGQFQSDKGVVKLKPPSAFKPGSGRPEVMQAIELAASVKKSEMEIFSEQSRRDWGWTKEYVCNLFGFWEKVRGLPLTSYQAFQDQLARQFLDIFMTPSQKFKAAVEDLYTKLQKVHTDPLGFAITAVVNVCEIT